MRSARHFLRKEHVAAVTGADRDDGVILREMADEPALGIHIEERMRAAIPFAVLLLLEPLHRDRRPCAS